MSRTVRASLALAAALVGSVGALANPAIAATRPTPSTAPPAPKAYALVDADSGAVLAASNEHTPLPPASTVKIMTGLTALRGLEPDATINVSARAAAQPAMKIGMHEGESWPFTDALHSMYMVSANDAAYAIAETAGGTAEQFAVQMTDTAKQLGMRDSTFNDPAGLDDADSLNGGSRMSAFDLGIAARNALAVPEIAEAVKLVDYRFTGPDGVPHTLHNHNATFLERYPGATGMKTGYTARAGRGLVCTATRDGRTMIGVVLDIYDTSGWCGRLLDQGFATAANAPGTGTTVPAVKIFTAAARRRAVDAIPRTLGRPVLSTEVAAPPTSGAVTADTPNVAVSGNRASRPSTSRKPSPARASSSSVFSTRNVVLGIVALVLALLFLRRRAVKRRRKRRMIRQKALADARRRGMLHVLDPDAKPDTTNVAVIHDRRYG